MAETDPGILETVEIEPGADVPVPFADGTPELGMFYVGRPMGPMRSVADWTRGVRVPL